MLRMIVRWGWDVGGMKKRRLIGARLFVRGGGGHRGLRMRVRLNVRIPSVFQRLTKKKKEHIFGGVYILYTTPPVLWGVHK